MWLNTDHSLSLKEHHPLHFLSFSRNLCCNDQKAPQTSKRFYIASDRTDAHSACHCLTTKGFQKSAAECCAEQQGSLGIPSQTQLCVVGLLRKRDGWHDWFFVSLLETSHTAVCITTVPFTIMLKLLTLLLRSPATTLEVTTFTSRRGPK